MESTMQAEHTAANQNGTSTPSCLTYGDRALLRAVTGWHLPGEALVATAADASGRPVLIPVLAWVLADARRSGALIGPITPGAFAAACGAVNRSHSASLHLSRAQTGAGFRHLAINLLGFSADKAKAAAG